MQFYLDSLDNTVLSMLSFLKLIIVLCLYKRISFFLEVFGGKNTMF